MAANGRHERRSPFQNGATAMNNDKSLREHLVDLITGSNAHADFEAAIKDFPAELRGKTPKGAEHSAWQILEHLRIAQWDILEFSRDPKHESPKWPEGYWPATAAPPDDKAWDKSVRSFWHDQKAMCDLIGDSATDLYVKIPHGTDQTVLREALLVADHNAYHVGQLVLVRRLLGAW
jgi:DinB superfamily